MKPCSLLQDSRGHSLWQLTWTHARDISSGLSPQLLASTGVAAPIAPALRPAAAAAPAEDPGAVHGITAATVAAPAVAASPLAAALAAAEKQVRGCCMQAVSVLVAA